MTQHVTAPQCTLQVYPFEGGTYTLTTQSGAVLGVDVEKNIRSSTGTFTLTLAPGGPHGPNARPSWNDIITPMSLVIIAMARGAYRQVVMMGVVRNCEETEEWRVGKRVIRVMTVRGVDFQYFFTLPSYYTTSFLAGAVTGAIPGAEGLKAILSDSLLVSSPDKFGAAWYKKIMAGPTGIMNDLSFAYQGSRVKFYDLVGQYWQPYDANIEIPIGDYFMLSEGNWLQKFRRVFPFPWYEFFVITAPPGAYPNVATGNTGYTDPSTFLTVPGFVPSVPQIVARINPLPWTKPKSLGGGKTLPPLAWDASYWNALPNWTTDETSGIDHSIYFSDDEVRNFYVINPVWLTAQMGNSNMSNAAFIYTFSALVDTASIHRYGYRPHIAEIEWLNDPTGAYAKKLASEGKGPQDFEQLVQLLAFRQSSYFEPTPNMARAMLTTRLRPDVVPGTRFTFSPYKDNQMWQFYIEGVSHHYRFGEASTTTFQLTRGLPKDVYDSEAMMISLHTGNAQRLNGSYQSGIPSGLGPTLAPVNYNTDQSIVGGIAKIFSSPQS